MRAPPDTSKASRPVVDGIMDIARETGLYNTMLMQKPSSETTMNEGLCCLTYILRMELMLMQKPSSETTMNEGLCCLTSILRMELISSISSSTCRLSVVLEPPPVWMPPPPDLPPRHRPSAAHFSYRRSNFHQLIFQPASTTTMSCFNGAWALLEDNVLGIAVVRPRNRSGICCAGFHFFSQRPTAYVIGSSN